jgi:hypothetical protein
MSASLQAISTFCLFLVLEEHSGGKTIAGNYQVIAIPMNLLAPHLHYE